LDGSDGATTFLCEDWVRDLANAGRFQWAQKNICDELSAPRRTKVDSIAIVPGLLVTELLSKVDLEELEAAKLEPSLDQVAQGGGAKTACQCTHALGCNHLTKTTKQTFVVSDRIELNACLHDIHWTQTSMRNGAAKSSTKGTIEVVCGVVLGPVVD